MYKAKAYSAGSATSPLASTMIARRDPTEHDVQIEILFCGICHSDLHSVRNERVAQSFASQKLCGFLLFAGQARSLCAAFIETRFAEQHRVHL
jgi:hypothetical protein